MKSLLKQRLVERRIKQREFAQMIGVSEVTVSLWTTDSGIQGVSLRRLSKIAKLLDCAIQDLYEEG